jgi:catechol 2,3-dioxygenase-like lactoylglutathione lyase family enzyme
MTLIRMDNVGIVVESLDGAISFFTELGLKLEGRAMIEGEWARRVTGLGSQRVEIAMMVTPDGHSRLEISRFLIPPAVADHRNAPINALGYLRVMFTVDDIDETLARFRKRGAQPAGEVVQYDEAFGVHYIASGWGEKSNWYKNIMANHKVTIQVNNKNMTLSRRGLRRN